MAGDDGVIRGPADEGRSAVSGPTSPASRCRAARPGRPPRPGLRADGPEALSFDEVAAIIGENLGREVTFVDETLAEAYASRRSYGAPDWQVDAWVSTYTAMAAGEQERVTGDIRALTGHDPQTLGEFLDRV